VSAVNLSRREFIKSVGAGIVVAEVGGCCHFSGNHSALAPLSDGLAFLPIPSGRVPPHLRADHGGEHDRLQRLVLPPTSSVRLLRPMDLLDVKLVWSGIGVCAESEQGSGRGN